jgi:oxalate decarboxylase/phosphoglucose isomerase-like protein (cupin superfamily)
MAARRSTESDASHVGLACGACALSLLLSAAALAQSGEGPVSRAELESPVVPVHEEPHHRQVFQYGPTRILDLQVPPGDISWFHTHEWPVLYMTLGTSAVRTQNLGSDWSGGGARAANAQAGSAPRPAQPPAERRTPRATSTTSYIEKPVTHRLENRGDGLFSAMVVVNETAGDDTISVADAGFALEPELTNNWFRSYRVTLGAGATTDAHAHKAPVVIFQAIAGKAKANGPMDFELNRPGQWAFYDVGVGHTLENLGDAPIELLEIEVRAR